MNRPLKFRAWWTRKDNAPFAVTPVFDKMLYDETPGDCLRWQEEGQKLVIMQYTGLKDKNGTEIYEGDVVQHTHHQVDTDYENGTYVIEWEGAGFIGNHTNGNRGSAWRPTQDSHKHRESVGSFEVIGNIYENPELLEETN